MLKMLNADLYSAIKSEDSGSNVSQNQACKPKLDNFAKIQVSVFSHKK